MKASEPREFKVKCVLGAIFAPERGNLNEFSARNRVQTDTNNTVPQTFHYRSMYPSERPANPEISQRLKNVSQNSGGILPQVNPYIGAPMATFVYGGIAPNSAHPQLDSIKGPDTNTGFEFEEGVIYAYDPSFDGGEATFGDNGRDGEDAPEFEPPQPFSAGNDYAGAQYPVVPSQKSAPFNSDQVLPTYNIWQLKNIDNNETTLQYKKNYGPLFPNGYTGPKIRQTVGVDGSSYIEVTAANVAAQVERIFPISADLAYSSAKIYYPPRGEIQPQPREIKARGSDNSGFQLHFRHSQITNMSNSNSGAVNGSIQVNFGAKDTPGDGTSLQNFQLNLVPGKTPELMFYHPKKQSWETFPLQGSAFGSGEFSVYVHFAGPTMLIGFDTDVENWNAFVPLDDDDDWNQQYVPLIPANSRISMTFTNVTAAFQYGPMAFNNYHPEQLDADDDDSHLGRINVDFGSSINEADTISETNLNEKFQAHRFRAEGYQVDTETQERFDDLESTAAVYADWRRPNAELYYKETERTEGERDVSVRGSVVFDTTIEGPQFMHIRSGKKDPSSPPDPPSATLPLIRKMPWGDISDYFVSFDISNDFDLADNHSLLQATATIVLANLKTTARGRQILAAIEKNIMTIEVGAGPGVANTFFQGIILESETVNTPTGSLTTLKCQDISTTVLTDVPCQSVVRFEGMRYGRILEYAISMSGLKPWYEQSEDEQLALALDYRLGYSPVESSLASQVLTATPRKKIIDIIKPAIGLVVADNVLPVLYWDYKTERLRLDKRQSDEYLDELYFTGSPDPDTGDTLLPNSLTDREHGVLVGDWTVRTLVKQLHAGVKLFGQNWFSRIITAQNDALDLAERYSEEKLEELLNSVGEDVDTSSIEGGYVGYRKILIDQVKQNVFPDKLSLERYAEQLDEYLKEPYQITSFECYVTKPLKHQGQFIIKTFLGEQEQATSRYLYASVNYKFNKKDNFIRASVKGEQLPPLAYNNQLSNSNLGL